MIGVDSGGVTEVQKSGNERFDWDASRFVHINSLWGLSSAAALFVYLSQPSGGGRGIRIFE